MAIYRNIQMSFWTDPLVVDDFTVEEKLLYLYILTNPHTNLCGCYSISVRQMSFETGMTSESVAENLKRLQDHGCVEYDNYTKELLICKWFKYNWTASEKVRKPILAEVEEIKSIQFREYLLRKFNHIDTVSEDEGYHMDTTVTVTDTDTVSDTVTDTDIVPAKKKESKTAYGEYQNVKLTDKEYEKLIAEYGEVDTKDAIRYLDEYIEDKHKKYNSCYLTIRRWVINAVREKRGKEKKSYSELSAEMEWI